MRRPRPGGPGTPPTPPWAEPELLRSSRNDVIHTPPPSAGGERQRGWSPSGVREILGSAQAMEGGGGDFPHGDRTSLGLSREPAPSGIPAQRRDPAAGSATGQLLHRRGFPAAEPKSGPGEDGLGHAWPLHGAGAAAGAAAPPPPRSGRRNAARPARPDGNRQRQSQPVCHAGSPPAPAETGAEGPCLEGTHCPTDPSGSRDEPATSRVLRGELAPKWHPEPRTHPGTSAPKAQPAPAPTLFKHFYDRGDQSTRYRGCAGTTARRPLPETPRRRQPARPGSSRSPCSPRQRTRLGSGTGGRPPALPSHETPTGTTKNLKAGGGKPQLAADPSQRWDVGDRRSPSRAALAQHHV